MSGIVVGRALRNRFESIRQNELERLQKKMRGLPDDQRQSVEDITVDVVRGTRRVGQGAGGGGGGARVPAARRSGCGARGPVTAFR